MNQLIEQLETLSPCEIQGRISHTTGTTIAVSDFPVPLGALVEIQVSSPQPLLAEVIGFQEHQTLVSPLGEMTGLRRGNRVRLKQSNASIRVGNRLLGRVLNAHGECIDGKPSPKLTHRTALQRNAPAPIERPSMADPIATGIRSIDSCLTCGQGQRMGIFARSGVGKSVLTGMLARHAQADVIIVAMIGERGREVREFLEHELGAEGQERSVVVVATSDEPAPMRVRAAFVALSLAEHFRDQGKNVLLLMDSLTRLAQAQREIGLAAGEPPATRGYPPSVFNMLPKVIERTGGNAQGNITGFFTVLQEGDESSDLLSDAVRGLLDGHLYLSQKLAERGHYPAIDILKSISRCMNSIVDREHQQAANQLRELLSVYQEHEELIAIGAYRQGSNATLDHAIALRDSMRNFLRQDRDETTSFGATRQQLLHLLSSHDSCFK